MIGFCRRHTDAAENSCPMKVILLQPPIQDFYETDIRLQPLGLASLKAAVKKFLPGVDIQIRDYHQGRGRKTIPIPQELIFLREFYPWPDKSPFALFHNYYHFGASFQQIAEEVDSRSPDLVGISAHFSPYYQEVLQTARAIKARTNIPVLVGGPHATVDPLGLLADPAVDYVIRGEGERPLVELLKALQQGSSLGDIPNLAYKEHGKTRLNPMQDNYTLDAIPPPDFSDFNLQTYRYRDKPLCFVTTSRGCPYQCAFCSIHQTFGHHYRRRNTSAVLDEIVERYQQGYRVFDFEDDNLSYDREAFKNLCRGLIERFRGTEVTFLAMNGLCYQNLDREVLTLMRMAGFRDLNISLVSVNDRVNKDLRRPHSLKKFGKVVETAHDLGFQIVSYVILGLPNETLTSMQESIIYLSRLPVLLGVSPFYLLADTAMHRFYEHPHEALNHPVQARSTALGTPLSHYDREDIYTLFILARIINFLKGLDLSNGQVSLKAIIEQKSSLAGKGRLGLEILQRLLSEGVLYSATGGGLRPLPKFKTDLFRQVWDKSGYIITRKGNRIQLD